MSTPLLTLKQHYWRARSSLATPTESLARWTMPLQCRLARANGSRVFSIDLNNDKLGFFAHLNLCLQLLYFCERQQLKPHIALTSANYLDPERGPSWLDYYFDDLTMTAADRDRIASGAIRTCRVRNGREMGIPRAVSRDYFARIDLRLAHDLMARHYRLAGEVQDRVERFVASNFQGRTPVAVHFRGTDKAIEAPRVGWEHFLSAVRSYIERHPEVDCVFVASDESGFIDFMTDALRDVAVCHHEDHVRSVNGQAVHLGGHGGDKYLKGLDALVNCLLMARCSVLFKPCSLLSAWASVFNPDLPVVLLNRPLRADELWFPETEIAAKSLDQYLPAAPKR